MRQVWRILHCSKIVEEMRSLLLEHTHVSYPELRLHSVLSRIGILQYGLDRSCEDGISGERAVMPQALRMLRAMLRSKVEPDVTSYGAAMSATARRLALAGKASGASRP